MAKSKAAPAAATEEARKSRTIYVSDSEWEEINKDAERQGRKVSRHIVMLVREARA